MAQLTDSATRPTETVAPLSDAELGAWRGFLRAHSAVVKGLDDDLERAHGLALSSYEVLLHLAEAPEGRLRMSGLADAVLLSRSGLTRRVDRLERDGLIERVSCPSDARGALAVITPAGRAALRAARQTHLAGVRERFLAHLSPTELAELGALWERVVPGAGSDPGPPCGSDTPA